MHNLIPMKTTRKSPRFLSKEQHAEIVRSYRQFLRGKEKSVPSFTQTAKQYGITLEGVRVILRRNGILPALVLEAARKIREKKIEKLMAKHLTASEIAKELGVDRLTVMHSKVAQKIGFTRKPRKVLGAERGAMAKALARFAKSGMTQAAIANRFSVTQAAVSRAMYALGVAPAHKTKTRTLTASRV